MRSSAQSVVGERRARLARALPLLFIAAMAPSAAAGQNPVLRIAGEPVQGVVVDGSAAYPIRSLERLGFRVVDRNHALIATIGADTLRFTALSPFFQAAGGLHQLAYAPQEIDGALHLPEQFFIQWLPTTYPERFTFRGGAVEIRATVTTVARGTPAPAREPEPRRAEQRVVVIDPGHGGRDPGRIGPNGVREKDVTLEISHRLAQALRERGYEVHLTRSTDEYVSLPERPKLANEWKGERPVAVFLSIHANAAPSSSVRGFETFFLSEARTADERRVAEMENEAIRFDDHPPAAADAGLDQILNTLRSDFLMRASHDLAAVIQDRFAVFHPGPNRGVKRAGFYVLVGTIMPAVLIETAILSNRDEARLLNTQSFQTKIVDGIADGVDEFFRRNEHLWVTGS